MELNCCCDLCGCDASDRVFVKDGYELAGCRSCGLVYVSNPPRGEDLARLYSAETGYHTDILDVTPSDYELGRARQNLALLSRHKSPGRLLDVGCSAGTFMLEARKAGWEVRGVEAEQETARFARDTHGLDVMTGTLEDVGCDPDSFDAVTLWDVIEHVPNPVETARTISRILSQDGILLVSTPNIGGLFPRLSYRASGITGHWRHPEPPYHLFQFSRPTITRLLASAGFEVERVVSARIRLGYTFGYLKDILSSPRMLMYTVAFAPAALLGPLLGMGDHMSIVARKA